MPFVAQIAGDLLLSHGVEVSRPHSAYLLQGLIESRPKANRSAAPPTGAVSPRARFGPLRDKGLSWRLKGGMASALHISGSSYIAPHRMRVGIRRVTQHPSRTRPRVELAVLGGSVGKIPV